MPVKTQTVEASKLEHLSIHTSVNLIHDTAELFTNFLSWNFNLWELQSSSVLQLNCEPNFFWSTPVAGKSYVFVKNVSRTFLKHCTSSHMSCYYLFLYKNFNASLQQHSFFFRGDTLQVFIRISWNAVSYLHVTLVLFSKATKVTLVAYYNSGLFTSKHKPAWKIFIS